MKDLLKFISLPHSEKFTVLKAFSTVLRVRFRLWCFPKQSIQKWLVVSAEHAQSKVAPADWKAIEFTVASVERCSRYIPGATCLTQALAVSLLLQDRGQPSNLRIGVEKDPNGQFRAHAWVEVEEQVIIGKVPLLSRFTVLESSTLVV